MDFWDIVLKNAGHIETLNREMGAVQASVSLLVKMTGIQLVANVLGKEKWRQEMNFGIVLDKGFKGLVTVITSLLVAQLPALQEWVIGFIPEEWASITLAGVVAFLINALTNYLKHRNQ